MNKRIPFLSAALAISVLMALPHSVSAQSLDEAIVTGEEPIHDLPLDDGGIGAPAVATSPEEKPKARVPAQVESEPTQFEKRLFRIFKQSAPITTERWSELVGSRRQEVYVVQSGDTLWDISQTLFGDGFFWSKLWAENSGLENPHQITMNQQIQLMSGTEANAPSISVGKGGAGGAVPAGGESFAEDASMSLTRESSANEPTLLAANGEKVPLSSNSGGPRAPVYRDQALKGMTPEELASGTNIEIDEIIPAPELPEKKASKRLLKKLPPSFLVPLQAKAGEYDRTGLDAGTNKAQTVPATIIPNSYLADRDPESVGVIEEIEAQEKTASMGQTVFLKLVNKARIGERFSVLLPKHKIKTSSGEIGPVVEIGGRVQVTGVMNEDKNVYRATIIQGINPIHLGSILSRERLPKSNFSRRGTRTTIEATIIGGEFDESRRIIGEGAVVYLDQGHQAGLNNGDILPVRSRRTERRADTKFPDYDRAVGLLKLVKVEAGAATGIVLETSEEILVGDKTGGRLSPNVFVPEEIYEEKSSL